MHGPVFISYCSEDSETAKKVCDLLEHEGIRCWIAPRDVIPGAIYPEEIIKAIEQCSAMALVFSSTANSSTHVRSEVERAFSHNKTIIPFRIENVLPGKALEYFLSSSQWLDAWEGTIEEMVEELAGALTGIAGKMDQETPLAEEAGREPSISPRRHNLPSQSSEFIGREKEAAAIHSLLSRDGIRLVTLTGMGGTGKTRLALRVASELVESYKSAVSFVSLALINDPELVASTIAQVLEVPEIADQPSVEELKIYLKDKRMLLVLDNFEQVVEAAPLVSELLSSCRHLKVLVTSREMLHVSGEHTYAVPTLRLPMRAETSVVSEQFLTEVSQYEAMRLFVDRAKAVQPSFEINSANAAAVTEICHRIDGLPLAIELAAARTRLLPPQKLLERLDKRLPLLTRGLKDRPGRQQTLRGTIAWSYDLLDEGEKMLFRRLSVFVGGFTLEAAEAVCGAAGETDCNVLDGMSSLEERSLLKSEETGGEPRFAMLETVREYAEELLAGSEEAETVRKRHAEFFYTLASEAEPELNRADRVAWLDRLEEEHNNFRSVLAWSIEGGREDLGLELAGVLSSFWYARGHPREGRKWLDEVMIAGGDTPSAELANVMGEAGYFSYQLGDNSRAMPLLERSLAMYREISGAKGLAHALWRIGFLSFYCRDYEKATTYLTECITVSTETGNDTDRAGAYRLLGQIAAREGDLEKAQGLVEEGLAFAERGGDIIKISRTRVSLGLIAIRKADFERAAALIEESLAVFQQTGHKPFSGWALQELGTVAMNQGNLESAKELTAEALGLFGAAGIGWGINICLSRLADIAEIEGRSERAVRLRGAAVFVQGAFEEWGSVWREGRDAAFAAMRQQLGEKKFETLRKEGQGMSQKEAIEYALEDLG